jgi:hypothetical protein
MSLSDCPRPRQLAVDDVDHRLYESVEHSDIIAQRAPCWVVVARILSFWCQGENCVVPLPWTS